MADPVFRSRFRADMEAFIIQKRAVGYPYNTSAKVLGYLDAMISKSFPDSEVLSREICNAWIDECSSLHQNTLLRRVTPVRQFGKYLVGTGRPAYIIPGGIPRKQIHYDAHIFTEAELKAFFSSIDQCRKSPFSPYRCYVIPVIFRLLYTCGLRASEARLLNVDDVDLDTGKMQPAIEKMQKIETFEKEAGPRKIQNVQKHIEKAGQGKDSQERSTSKSRTEQKGDRGRE